jgi:hypothetical protein
MKMRNVGIGLASYAASHRNRFPPFAFSSGYDPVLALSGHFGGAPASGNLVSGTPRGADCVNLWSLVRDEYIRAAEVICPGDRTRREDPNTSYFPYTGQYSTYCLRFPPSEDLFAESPAMAYFRGKSLLFVYTYAAGGVSLHLDSTSPIGDQGPQISMIPLVRLDRRYRLAGGAVFDPAAGALLSDAFWRKDYSEPAPSDLAGQASYSVRASWCHGDLFNVLYGDGSLRCVAADESVRANTVSGNVRPPDDGQYYATYAEAVWQRFEAAK